MARRIFGVLSTAFFDDNATLDLQVAFGWGQAAVKLCYTFVGALLSVPKSMPMASERIFLGTTVSLGMATVTGEGRLDTKPGIRQATKDMLVKASEENYLSATQSGKVRGRCNGPTRTAGAKLAGLAPISRREGDATLEGTRGQGWTRRCRMESSSSFLSCQLQSQGLSKSWGNAGSRW